MSETPVQRILIVEDDAGMRTLLMRVMRENGYEPVSARGGREMLEALATSQFDLILLDVMMPGKSGLDLCRDLRRTSSVPIIMVSAHGEEIDRVLGLEMGADDYVAKPFGAKELLARVRSLLRRHGGEKTTVFEHRGLKLDLLARSLHCHAQNVELTAREFALLELFMQNPGRVLTRTMIAEKVWDSYYDADTNLLDVYMRRLRRKLEAPGEKPWFKTLRGVGYQLI